MCWRGRCLCVLDVVHSGQCITCNDWVQWCETAFASMAKLARVVRSGSMMSRALRIDHHLAMSALATTTSLPRQLLTTMKACAAEIVKLKEELDERIRGSRSLRSKDTLTRGQIIAGWLVHIQGMHVCGCCCEHSHMCAHVRCTLASFQTKSRSASHSRR